MASSGARTGIILERRIRVRPTEARQTYTTATMSISQASRRLLITRQNMSNGTKISIRRVRRSGCSRNRATTMIRATVHNAESLWLVA